MPPQTVPKDFGIIAPYAAAPEIMVLVELDFEVMIKRRFKCRCDHAVVCVECWGHKLDENTL